MLCNIYKCHLHLIHMNTCHLHMIYMNTLPLIRAGFVLASDICILCNIYKCHSHIIYMNACDLHIMYMNTLPLICAPTAWSYWHISLHPTWCSVLQVVSVCCSVLQCIVYEHSLTHPISFGMTPLTYKHAPNLLQCVASSCSVLHCVSVCRVRTFTYSSNLLRHDPTDMYACSQSVAVCYR